MTTPLALIRLALLNAGVNGVGQAPSAEDTSDCLLALNGMLSQWAKRRWLVFHELDLSVMSTGAQSYSIGPTGAFVCARVDRIERAYLRINPGTNYTVDYPVAIISSPEDYADIGLKGLAGGLWGAVFLDSGYPNGTLYFWPIPATGYELHVLIKAPLVSVSAASLNTDMALPDEYFEALLYNLAVRIAPMYQLPQRPDVVGLANAALATIRAANMQVPVLKMPAALMNRRGAQWPLAIGAYGGGVGVYGGAVYGGATFG